MRDRLVEFLQALPDVFPDPDLLLEEDGMYCVEWYNMPKAQVSVSVGETGYNYACLFHGQAGVHGFIPKEMTVEMVILLVDFLSRAGIAHRHTTEGGQS